MGSGLRSPALVALLLAGCASVAPSEPGPRIPRPEPPPESGLVWMVDEAGRHRTLWVALDGSPLASQPIEGPLWAWEGSLWQWVEEPIAIPLHEALEDDSGQTRETGTFATVSRGVLRELVDDVRVEVIAPPAAGTVRLLDHRVELVGSVGPYVFLTESIYADAFGAHGSTEARAVIWDLRAAGPTEVLTERERDAIARREANVARARLREGTEAGRATDVSADTIELVALWPRWSERGLSVDLQLATEACYACGDGLFGDYTRSVRVRSETVPEQLAAHGRVPPWVRAAMQLLPGARVAGFSLVHHPSPALVLDTLHR